MKLLTKANEKKLLANGTKNRGVINPTDFKPVVKLFTPWANATWLLTEMYPDDPDVAFGLCDLGHGCPELGPVSLSELKRLSGPAGLKVERDRYFSAEKTLSEYTADAKIEGRISA